MSARRNAVGLSDGNLIWDVVPTLDGLGPSGDNDHCSERSADGSKLPEYVDVGVVCAQSDAEHAGDPKAAALGGLTLGWACRLSRFPCVPLIWPSPHRW